jgi:hypothetical protein
MSDEPDRTSLTTQDRLRMYAAWKRWDDVDFLDETADYIDAQAARIAALEGAMREALDLVEVDNSMWAHEVLARALGVDNG